MFEVKEISIEDEVYIDHKILERRFPRSYSGRSSHDDHNSIICLNSYDSVLVAKKCVTSRARCPKQIMTLMSKERRIFDLRAEAIASEHLFMC